MAYTIEVRDLRVSAVMGVPEEERGAPQPLRVDLDLDVATEGPEAVDELATTVDYAPLLALTSRAIELARPRLLETACTEVAHAILGADERVQAVTVTVAKLRPPVPEDVGTVGVRRRVER